jgi:hypothetical protein
MRKGGKLAADEHAIGMRERAVAPDQIESGSRQRVAHRWRRRIAPAAAGKCSRARACADECCARARVRCRQGSCRACGAATDDYDIEGIHSPSLRMSSVRRTPSTRRARRAGNNPLHQLDPPPTRRYHSSSWNPIRAESGSLAVTER